jgi:hypothetical protein
MSGSLIPNGKQQFIDSNGNPLASGKVYYYIPNTTTPKNTYQDSALTILNTNPIILDANGQCEAWANSGSFRQQVYDVNNNLIWDVESDAPASYGDIAALQADIAAFESSSGATLIGYKEGGSGSVTRTVAAKLNEVISVKDFGAVGDGVTNDQPAIQAAIAYAETLNAGYVYFPIGNYYITSGISFSSPIGIDCASGATITTSANTFPAVTLSPTNYANAILNIPAIVGGSIGLYVKGSALATINFPSIVNAVDGLVLEVNNTNLVCADNIINFTVIQGCSGSGVKFQYLATTLSGTLMQGNQIKGNFITGTKYGIQFYDVNNGGLGLNLPWDDTEIDVFAVDMANISGSICIYGNPQLPPARTTWRHRGFFGGADLAYIKGNAIGNLFELSFPSPPEYAKMQLLGGGNRLIETSGGQNNLPGINPIPALTTTYNTISTFNGGTPIQANRCIMEFTLASPLTAGTVLGFYFYHPLMTQYRPKVTYEAFWNMQISPMMVGQCIECSTPGVEANPYPFQGYLEVYAIGTVPAATYQIAITVHDAPQ